MHNGILANSMSIINYLLSIIHYPLPPVAENKEDSCYYKRDVDHEDNYQGDPDRLGPSVIHCIDQRNRNQSGQEKQDSPCQLVSPGHNQQNQKNKRWNEVN